MKAENKGLREAVEKELKKFEESSDPEWEVTKFNVLALIDAHSSKQAERIGNRLEEIKTRVIQSHGSWGGDKEFANSFLREALKEIEDWQAELSQGESK